MLIVPNIYESRDSEEDKKKINSRIFIEKINHPNKIDWESFEKKEDSGLSFMIGLFKLFRLFWTGSGQESFYGG